MATKTRRRSNPVTTLFQDLVDDTKVFVDDLLDRTKNLELDARDAVRDGYGEEGCRQSAGEEIEDLHASIARLSTTVDRLASAQRKAFVTDLESKTKAELQDLADARGLDSVDQATQTKDEMIARMKRRLLP